MTALKPASLDRQLARPDPAIRLWLFAGPDEAGSAEALRQAAARLGDPADPMALVDLAPSTLGSDPGLLADEAASLPMFGGRRLIRVAGAGEGVIEAVRLLLAAPAAGNPVVMTAGDLGRASRLRQLAEADAAVRLVLFWPLGTAEAGRWLAGAARTQGLRLADGVAERMLIAHGADTGVLGAELQTLALYLDAAPDRPAELRPEHLAALGTRSAEDDMGALVAAITTGERAAVARQLALFEGASPIPALRAMARRLLQLAEIRAAIQSGARPADAVGGLRPPLFWKERDAVLNSLGRWPLQRIGRALEAMLDAERAIKQPGSAGDIAGWEALWRLPSEEPTPRARQAPAGGRQPV
jgi:DNA polymerase-3 subunit delta